MIGSSTYAVYVVSQGDRKLAYKIVNPPALLGPSSGYAVASLYTDDLDKIVSDRVLYWLEKYKKLHDAASIPGIGGVVTSVPTGATHNTHTNP
jgi:hypothetical protein